MSGLESSGAPFSYVAQVVSGNPVLHGLFAVGFK